MVRGFDGPELTAATCVNHAVRGDGLGILPLLIEVGMVSFRSGKFGVARQLAAGLLLGGSLLSSAGCSLIPTTQEISSAASLVKDTVTGKAKRDKLNKTYAEARILERRKDFAAAEKLYRELLVAQPKSRDCYHRLGVMAAVQGKYPEAQQLYQTALTCSEPTPDLLSDIGYCHYLQQQLPQAEQALRAALQIQPQHSAALNNLAMVVGEQDNLDEAYELFRRAGDAAEAECNFAYLCAQRGDLRNAQAHFSRALDADPNLKPAAEALLQVSSELQHRQKEAYEKVAQAQAEAAQRAANGQVQIGTAPQYPVQQASAEQQASMPGQAQVQTEGVSLAGGYANAVAAQAHGVQLASGNGSGNASIAAAGAPPKMIEVYRASPRTPAATAQAAATMAQSTAAANAAAPQAPAAPPAAPSAPPSMQTPVNAGWANGMPVAQAPVPGEKPAFAQPSFNHPQFAQSTAPTPFSFPSSSSPQYLQPSMSSRLPETRKEAAGRAAPAKDPNVAPASYSAPVRGVSAPTSGTQPAGLSFPPLVN